MKTNSFKYIYIFVSVLTLVSSGCTENTKKAPPKDQVRDAVSAAIQPFLLVEGIEIEPIPTGSDTVKVNFKAIIVPKEDLFVLDRMVELSSPVPLIKLETPVRSKSTIYGSVVAERTMDNWRLGEPDISKAPRLGAPRNLFGAQAVVAGSSEAHAVLKQEVALKERLQKEEEVVRQKLLQATAPGVRYIGTIAYQNQRQRICLIFTEQKGFLLRAEASNPEKPSERQTFFGELVFPPKPNSGLGTEKAYSILLSPTSKQPGVSGRWDFYENEGTIGLNLTDSGLDGDAKIYHKYELRFQKE